VNGIELTLLDEGKPAVVPAFNRSGVVRVAASALRDALGWDLKPQGFCKADRCVPVRDPELVTDEGVDLAGFAELLSRPLAIDIDERVACLGASAADRSTQLVSLEAPDFTLSDLDGRRHSLSDHRGKKVLLVAYASW
jgi:hypothetical protein